MADPGITTSPIRAYLLISRREFLPSITLFAGIPVTLAIADGASLRQNGWHLASATLVFVLAYLIGSKVNCLADHELDRDFKTQLHNGISALGKRAVWALVVIESVLATGIAAYLSWQLGRWVLLAMWILGWVLAFMYSVEPFRFKRRGLLNVLTLIIVLTFLPPAFIYLTLRGSFTVLSLAFIVALNIQIAATVFINEIEDYPEDRDHGVLNPCVRWGIKNTALVSLITLIVGCLVLMAVAITYRPSAWWLAVPLFTLGYYPVIRPFVAMFRLCAQQERNPSDVRFNAIRDIGRHLPLWLIWLGVPIVLTLVLALIGHQG
jgi:4-hydroxybenzoate polyprenyltransferase